MLGTLRGTAKRTLVLTGILIAAVSISTAAGLMVRGATVEGSVLLVTISNSSTAPMSGIVSATVLVNEKLVVMTSPVAFAGGESGLLVMDAGETISAVSSVGVIGDNPIPF